MSGEIITKNNYPEIYAWLSENVLVRDFERRSGSINLPWCKFDDKYSNHFTYIDNKIHSTLKLSLQFRKNIKEIKYPFGEINESLSCSGCCKLQSLKNTPEVIKGAFICSFCVSLVDLKYCPHKIYGGFDIDNCYNITSFKNFPLFIGTNIYFNYNTFSNNIKHKDYYDKYIDMWIEFLESVSDDDKIEYFNNYKDKTDYYNYKPIIPKEIIDKYKIEYLLKK